MDTLLAVQVRRLLLHWLVRTTAGVQDYCADRLRGIVGSVHPATKRHLNKETWKLAAFQAHTRHPIVGSAQPPRPSFFLL